MRPSMHSVPLVVQDGQLDHNLDRMRYACMDLLMQLPRTFKTKKLGTIFLINNFNHVAMVGCNSACCSQTVHAKHPCELIMHSLPCATP